MADASTLERPTKRDEDWRYADIDAVAKAWPQAIETIAVGDGERYHHQIVMSTNAGERVAQRVDTPFGDGAASRHVYTSAALADDETCLQKLVINVGKNATAVIHALIGGGRMARIEIEVTLEEGAHFEFGGVTIGGGDATQEFVTRTIHAHPGATSNQTVRAVQWGKSTGNFLGRIEVARDAQKTDAAQNFRAILLEKGASANTKPELEIFADDVQCAHGAAIGELDKNAAYYMAARGIPPHIARKLLVQAFIGDAFVELHDAQARERLLEQALEKLEEAEL